LDIYNKHYGEYHADYARTLFNLCESLDNLKEYEKAKEGYEKLLDIRKKLIGENHVDYANTFLNLCSTL
jgi:tetratricopeptide (TPR) repeat protein